MGVILSYLPILLENTGFKWKIIRVVRYYYMIICVKSFPHDLRKNMSFNSPFDNQGQNANNSATPTNNTNSSDFNYANVPAYGNTPHVQPTGKNSTLSIIGLILSILFPLVGLVVSIVAWKQTAETGDSRGLAKAGIIVGAVLLALNIIFTFVFFGAMTTATMNGTLTSP